MTICVKAMFLGGIIRCTKMQQLSCMNLYFKPLFSSVSPLHLRINGPITNLIRTAHTTFCPLKHSVPVGHRTLGLYIQNFSSVGARVLSSQTFTVPQYQIRSCYSTLMRNEKLLQGHATLPVSSVRCRVTGASLSGVPPSFIVMKFDQEGSVTTFEKRKTELCQELSLQARDLRFQHSTSLSARNNCIIIRMRTLKAIVTLHSLLVLDFRGFDLERWLVLDLASQLASQTHSLPFEFRALEAILQHKVNFLQTWLKDIEPIIMDILESLMDPKILSADRSKLHVLLQNSKSLSELETDIKVFKDSLLKILDEEELIEELCLTKRTDSKVFEEMSEGIDHAEEMELLLDNYYLQAEDLGNKARELKSLIDDTQSVIFINLDSQRNLMMLQNLQLTMGSFSINLLGLLGLAFGMNLSSSLEEVSWAFWLVMGIMFLGSGLIWRRLLLFLGQHLEHSSPLVIHTLWKRNLKTSDMKIRPR